MADIEECNMDVYKYGNIVGVYDMPKDEAEALCVQMTKDTGRPHDWHYFAGRVVIKDLPEGFVSPEAVSESPWA